MDGARLLTIFQGSINPPQQVLEARVVAEGVPVWRYFEINTSTFFDASSSHSNFSAMTRGLEAQPDLGNFLNIFLMAFSIFFGASLASEKVSVAEPLQANFFVALSTISMVRVPFL